MTLAAWVSLAIAAAGMIGAFYKWRSSRSSEELGKIKAEMEGRKSVQDVLDTLDRVDAGRVPKPRDEP